MTTQQRYPRYVILNRRGDMAVAGDEADAHAAGATLAPDGVLMFETRSDAQEYIRKVTASDLADLGLEPDGLVAVNVEQDSRRRCESCGAGDARYGGPFGEHLCPGCRGEANDSVGRA